jgi:hypothetical protein
MILKPDAEYPRVNDDASIEFRLKAPDATRISVKVGAAPSVDRSKPIRPVTVLSRRGPLNTETAKDS